MNSKFVKIVEMFNDGGWEDLEPHFETVENFIRIVDKAGLIEMIDPFNDELEDYQNELLIGLLRSGKRQEILNEIIGMLSDITVENGKIMCDFRNRSELSSFFEGRGYGDYDYEEIVKRAFGDSHNDIFFDSTTDDVNRDVIQELNPKNKTYLEEVIVKRLNGVKIELDGRSSDLMEEEAKRQGHEEYMTVDSSNIDKVIDDEETMNWLFDNDLHEIEMALYNVHRNAYETAYNDEVYKNIISEINQVFNWEVQNEYKWGKTYRFKLEVKYDKFIDTIVENLENNKGYHTLNYFGGFEAILTDNLKNGDGLWTFSVPDYPDSSLVDEYVNDCFSDNF